MSTNNKLTKTPFSKNPMKTKYLIALGLIFTTGMAFSQKAGPGSKNLKSEISYYISFDKSSIELDSGVAEIKSPQSQEFARGRSGMAMVAAGTKPTEIGLEKHIWSKPGALTIWVAPASWIQQGSATQRGLVVFLRLPLGNEGKFILERQGFDESSNRQDQLIAGVFGVPDFNEKMMLIPASTLNWEQNQWHLIAINWDKTSFSVSVDGKDFKTETFPRELTSLECPEDMPSSIQMGYNQEKSDEKTLIDELTIYKRPLTIGEVRSLMDGDSDE
jgi:hypothetical protein